MAMPNKNDLPMDIKVINNGLFIATQSGIWTRNIEEENWQKITMDEEIVKFIKKGQKLFGYTHRGEAIYFIKTKEKIKTEKVFDARDSIVMDVDFMDDKLWIATIPNYSWEEMKIQ